MTYCRTLINYLISDAGNNIIKQTCNLFSICYYCAYLLNSMITTMPQFYFQVNALIDD